MYEIIPIITKFIEPHTSPFFIILLLFIITYLNNNKANLKKKIISISSFIIIFTLVYRLIIFNQAAARWLGRLNSPFILIVALLIIPAIFLPRNKYYKLFLLIPTALIILWIYEIISGYNNLPADTGFVWFLANPLFFIAGFTGLLIIIQYFTSLDLFRKIVRITMFLILIYGGFAFRQNYNDYQDMLSRRKDFSQDIMNLSETSPVLRYDNRLVYLPGAPCRFSADGGYVQGCVMELFQRIFQIRFARVWAGDANEVSLFAIALAAFASIFILLYIGARWWCGWVCPLSTLGGIFDVIRKFLKLPYYKPVQPLKKGHFYAGSFLAGFTLVMSFFYTFIDKDGKFIGCKIPLYPFCKICPAQQVCPVAAKGLAGYPPVPGVEWLFGFFRYGSLLMLGIFAFGFMTARRLWCYLCPMGMLGGIFNRGAFLALKKDARKCNGCGICNDVCPMNIHYVQEEMEKEDVSCFDCIYCLKCVDKCPQDKCLSLEFCGKKITESEFKI